MRLFNVRTRTFEHFYADAPAYAIASHRWAAATETSYQDVQKRRNTYKEGYKKLEGFMEYIKTYIPDIEWLWIDTCCIDQENNAELSEAINSMYNWYQKAVVCLVYLADVSNSEDEDELRRSGWFTRGWTLQELIAPQTVVFLTIDWQVIGHKGVDISNRSRAPLFVGRCLTPLVALIAGVPEAVLDDSRQLEAFSKEERLKWVQGRSTSREEDTSYCLVGILDAAIGANYGEGAQMARRRLLKKIGLMVPEPSSNVPFRRDPNYIDRTALAAQINVKLAAPAARIALVGLGGVGKSQLAIEQCYRLREQQPNTWVLWLHASNGVRFEQSIRDVADLLKLYRRKDPKADILQLFREWLRDASNGSWLVVLDNADDASILLEPSIATGEARRAQRRIDYIPSCEHGSVLITTRSKSDALKLVRKDDVVNVMRMSEEEAEALLVSKLGRQSADDKVLVQAVDYIPLAIARAAAYIREQGPRYSVQQYCEKYEQRYMTLFEPVAQGDEDVDSDGASTDALSVFSDESIASSITSAGGNAFIPQIHIQHFVLALFCTRELFSIRRAALNDKKIGQERFERNFRRLIVNFGKSLGLESTTKDELGVAKLLRTRHFSARITRQTSENDDFNNEHRPDFVSSDIEKDRPWRGPSDRNEGEAQDNQSESSNDSSDSDHEPDDNTPNFEAVERFLLNCQAYYEFRLKLLDFVHSPYEGRILKALGSEAVNDAGELLSASGLLAISREISWAPTDVISFQSQEILSTSDQLKAMIENVMGEKWNWWPLSARRHPLRNGFIRVSWLTPCKAQQHIDVPEREARLLQAALATAPSFVNDALSIEMCSPGQHLAPNSQPSGSAAGIVNYPPLSPIPGMQLTPFVPGTYPIAPQSTVSTPFNMPNRTGRVQTSRHVYLCVRTRLMRDRYTIVERRTDTLRDDDDFYDWLKQTYIRVRGPLRHWLSPYRYETCEFVKFHKRREITPMGEGFPLDDDKDYQFLPCPLTDDDRPPNGPIKAIEFQDSYYNCPHHCHTWHKHRYRKLPHLRRDDIESLPQRKSCINLQDGRK